MAKAIMDGRLRAVTSDHNGRAWLAWHIVALPQAKRFPQLRDLMIRDRERDDQEQTWQQQLAVAKAWTLMLGGTVNKKAAH